MSKAYEYLKKNGYTQEFLKIFFEGVGDKQIINFNPDHEHVYMLRYDHEVIKEYHMFLKLR
jgi:hypothetical protein